MRISFWITVALTLLASGVFSNYPQIDIDVARLFYDNGFMGESAPAKAARSLLYGLPLAVCIGFMAARTLRLPPAFLPSSRTIIYLSLSMALGPGLLVNVILKDHWHRPRPNQVTQFGGPHEFRPIWTRDGACEKNCSFVSGEVASSFWLVAPASLAPLPYRVPAIAAALGVGVATGLLRMAFGGHFLSDVIFAGLFMLLLVIFMRAMIFPQLRPAPPQL